MVCVHNITNLLFMIFSVLSDCVTMTMTSIISLIILCDLYVRLSHFCLMSDMVHTRVEVHRIDSEMYGLVEQSWFQLICCAICLPCGHNFR